MTVAECYFQDFYIRKVSTIFSHFGIDSISSDHVSGVAIKLDAEFEDWRNRKQGEYPYLVLDARHEKQRQNGEFRANSYLAVIVLWADHLYEWGTRRLHKDYFFGNFSISVAVITAVGIDWESNCRIFGRCVAPPEAKIHWKDFLESLVDRGLGGIEYIVSDDLSGLTVARKAVFVDAKWRRWQFHLTQNTKK